MWNKVNQKEKQVEAAAMLDSGGAKQAGGGLWTGVYKYDTDSLLVEGFDARGVKTAFTYDGLNRVKTVAYTGESSYQTPTVTYTYDEAESGFNNIGRLTRVQTAANAAYGTPETVQNYDYDKLGQAVKHVQSIGNQSYQLEYGYNLAGQMVSEKYPSGKIVNMAVDDFGRLSAVADSQRTYLSGVVVDGRGLLSQINLGNGTSETYLYNDRFQMIGQELKKGSDVLQKYAYGYGHLDDQTGLPDATKNNSQLSLIESYIGATKQATQKFKYDHIGRLKESAEYRGDNGALTYKQVFDFDRFGNLYRKAASNPTAGQQNPLSFTPIEESTGPGTGDIEKTTNRFRTGTTYDDAGNVTTDNKFRDMGFAYDANGRQIKASRASVPDAWTVYDAAGNRVATKINNQWRYMVYDAMGKLVAEYGQKSDGMGGVKYVQQDWQGSVRTTTNANGFVVARTDHQAFGRDVGYGVGQRSIEQGYNRDAATRQGYGLTERDEASGRDHTWFRKNENSAGRWTSPDPYNGSMNLGDPQSFNRYSYVQNDPTNFVDPSGLQMVAVRRCRDVVRIAYTDGQFDSAWLDEVCETRYEWVDDVDFGGGGGGGDRKPLPDCAKVAILAFYRHVGNSSRSRLARLQRAVEAVHTSTNGFPSWSPPAIGERTTGVRQADAFTFNNTIFFANSTFYNTTTAAGMALLVHEFTHVMQYRESKLFEVRYANAYLLYGAKEGGGNHFEDRAYTNQRNAEKFFTDNPGLLCK